MATDCDEPPAFNVPLAGLNVTPFKLLDADQFKSPCEPFANESVTVQEKLPSLFCGQVLAPEGLDCSVGAAQLHVTVTVLGPENVKVL